MVEIEVKLPRLSEGEDAPQEATVSFFYVEEGQTVRKGDDFVEMITDKATFNVPAPESGRVSKILVRENQKVKVGQTLAILET